MDPSNFVVSIKVGGFISTQSADKLNLQNASWSINSLKVYSKTSLSAAVSSDTEQTISLGLSRWTLYLCILTGIAAQLL